MATRSVTMSKPEDEPCEFAALFRGGHADVPKSIAVCPECGGKLWVECSEWIDETGQPTTGGLSVSCYDEEAAVERSLKSRNDWPPLSEVQHRGWQSDWQPIIDKLEQLIPTVNV